MSAVGLDPPSRGALSALLDRVSSSAEVEQRFSAQVVVGLRPQDAVPRWSTHVAFVAGNRVLAIGEKESVIAELSRQGTRVLQEGEKHGGILEKVWAGAGVEPVKEPEPVEKVPEKQLEAIVEMSDVKISYFGTEILRDFSWTIRRGEKWGLFGPNGTHPTPPHPLSSTTTNLPSGSGKTTLISLLTSDHPLTYSLPIKHFGQTRLPTLGKPGISVFDIQRRIGHSSPEIHAFFPKHLSLRRTVASGFCETFLATPRLTFEQQRSMDTLLSTFADVVGGDGKWGELCFGEAGLSMQRLVLFLRAIVPRRELLVLDEAFSGMEEGVRDRCLGLLEEGGGWWDGKGAMVVVSHVSEEVPKGVERWIRLAERGRGKAEFGWV